MTLGVTHIEYKIEPTYILKDATKSHSYTLKKQFFDKLPIILFIRAAPKIAVNECQFFL